MTEMFRPRLRYVLGPDGSPLTIADLPPPTTKRWVIRRKAEVVAAVRGGLLSLDDACKRYKLTIDEFLSWQRLIERHGLPGLRATKVQDYRDLKDLLRLALFRIIEEEQPLLQGNGFLAVELVIFTIRQANNTALFTKLQFFATLMVRSLCLSPSIIISVWSDVSRFVSDMPNAETDRNARGATIKTLQAGRIGCIILG